MTAPDRPDRAQPDRARPGRPQPERVDQSHSAESATSAGLQLFLVRLRPSGTVCWVGSIHQHRHPETGDSICRGDRVVIQNAHGQWLAELLRSNPPSPVFAEAPEESVGVRGPEKNAPRPSGELLRIADAADEAAEQSARARAQQLLGATRREPLARDVVIVAAEVSLDEQIGIIRILGTADERFGPAAVRLATESGLQRIQWIDVSQPTGGSAARGETDDDAAARSCTPEQAEEAAFWQRMQQATADGVSLGSRYRVAAGNRGLYQQKLRLPASTQATWPNAPRSEQKWANAPRSEQAIKKSSTNVSEEPTAERTQIASDEPAAERPPTLSEPPTAEHEKRPLSPAAHRIAAERVRESGAESEPSDSPLATRLSGEAGTSSRRWMIRVRTAAGGLTPKQLQTLCRIATRFGDGTLRLTTRQAIQLHGVASEAAPEAMRQLQSAMLHTAGSCGNTLRNFTCCPLPPRSASQRHLRELAARLATDFLPAGPAFTCLPEWIEPSAERPQDVAAGQPEHMAPFPADATSSPASSVLPHKWKVGLAVDGHNCVDVLNNDLGIVLRRDAETSGRDRWLVDLYIGGSTAYQPERDGSMPRLASWLGTVASGEAAEALRGLLEIFQSRVLGERRHFRRWKYVVERLGVEAIREELREHTGGQPALQLEHPPLLESLRLVDDPPQALQIDGRTAFCLAVAGGRMPCTPELHQTVDELARLPITLRIGPQHRLVIADVRHQDLHTVRQAIDTIDQAATDGLQKRSLRGPATKAEWANAKWANAPRSEQPDAKRSQTASDDPTAERSPTTQPRPARDEKSSPLSPAAQRIVAERVRESGPAIACPALPTCPLAVDESERVLTAWWQVIAELARQHRVPPPRLAISGCANGCSRPMATDIGLIAEKKNRRRVYFAGNGYRLAAAIATVTTPNELRALLDPYFTHYAQTRRTAETFTDWYWREVASSE